MMWLYPGALRQKEALFMTLQQLAYLVAVAECGSITDAAERLFISQPSLSAAIHNLEKEMGVTAFVRSNKGVAVTREGEELLSCGLTCTGVNWIPDRPDEREFSCTAKFRYRQPDQEVLIRQTESGFEASFAAPQRAVTPGQYCVLYRGERCLGGGEIVSVVKSREKCR